MNLNKFNNKLNRAKISSNDYKIVLEIKDKLTNWIRDENLDEMKMDNKDYFTYSSKVKNKIDELLEDKNTKDKEETINQLYGLFKIK